MDPGRWSNEEMTDLERELIEAARSDRVPDALSARMAAALQVGGAAAAANTAAAEAAAAQGAASAKASASLTAPLFTRLFTPLVTKAGLWGTLSIGLVAAGSGWYMSAGQQTGAASGAMTQNQTANSETRAQETEPATPTAEPSVTDTQAAVQERGDGALATSLAASPTASPTATPNAPTNAPTNADEALRAEVALLARARAALRTHESARALQLLDQHGARHAGGALLPEAAALRIEALVQLGAREKARALSSRFIESYPNHPLRAQVEGLLRARRAGTASTSQNER